MNSISHYEVLLLPPPHTHLAYNDCTETFCRVAAQVVVVFVRFNRRSLPSSSRLEMMDGAPNHLYAELLICIENFRFARASHAVHDCSSKGLHFHFFFKDIIAFLLRTNELDITLRSHTTTTRKHVTPSRDCIACMYMGAVEWACCQVVGRLEILDGTPTHLYRRRSAVLSFMFCRTTPRSSARKFAPHAPTHIMFVVFCFLVPYTFQSLRRRRLTSLRHISLFCSFFFLLLCWCHPPHSLLQKKRG